MTEKHIQMLAQLGISDFESVDSVERRLEDTLERLETHGWFPSLRGALQGCTADKCGKKRCVEVCAFADWRRRLQQIPAAHRLITKAHGPVCEVRVVRGIWGRPIGDLRRVSIGAARQLNRRALDTLLIPTLVAVGTFKVSVAPSYYHQPHWICEIHQIVAGANAAELEQAFTNAWGKEEYDSAVSVVEVKEIGPTISDVLSVELKGWQHPRHLDDTPARPRKAEREEFYRWLLGLSLGERMIRYGCDRYLNELKKQPRTVRTKVRKPRPYPTWLARHMFGNREQPMRGGPSRRGRFI
jgi:hypothetical protein